MGTTKKNDRRFRPATEADMGRLVELHLAAYPDEITLDARRTALARSPFGTLSSLVVVEDDGVHVAQAFLFALRAGFGGRKVRLGGIASVAVAPEARGRGVATALLDHLHARSAERGDALTMLFAFRYGFYARLGYAAASPWKRLAFDPRSIPPAWSKLARIRGARGADRPAIEKVHERAVLRSGGMLVRPPAFWDRLFARERRIVLVCESGRRLAGYVAFTLEQEEAHAETILVVDDLFADDDVTRRALLGALGGMRDQVAEVVLEVACSDPLERALVDPDRRRFGTAALEHSLGEIVGGPMVRVGDVSRAILARGYAADGAFDLVVGERAIGVRARGGRAEIVRPRGRMALHTTPAGVAAIFYGGLSAVDAVTLGLARVEGGAPDRIDATVRLGSLPAWDAF